MRTKKEIIQEVIGTLEENTNDHLFLEVLVDIRDILENRLEQIQKAIDRPQIRYTQA